MGFSPKRPAAPARPVGVRLMVDFSTGRILGAERPAPAEPPTRGDAGGQRAQESPPAAA
jgi:hypothetical protein